MAKSNKRFFFQAKAIVLKNLLCSLRNKEIYTEVLLPLLAALFVSLKDKDPSYTLLMFSPILLSLAVFSTPRSLLIHLVEEKSEKFKETQKIMGLKQSSYVCGWLFYAYAKTLMSTIIFLCAWPLFTTLFNSGDLGLFGKIEWHEFYLIYVLYSIALLSQSLFFTTFFSDAKLASEVSTFLTIIALLVPYLGFIEKLQKTWFFVLLSLLPQCSISFVFLSQQEGLFSSLAYKLENEYTASTARIELALVWGVCFILYFYLDQVFPNEYGVAKSPFFFLHWKSSSKPKKKVLDIESGLLKDETSQNTEDSSSAYYHQKLTQSGRASVVIKNLKKTFGDFTAVDNISINLYSSQILCLLGHNGAGKTTTINLLTGLLQKNGGEVLVNGIELEENIDEIREYFGICNQRDVLYDELTVYEQLLFMGRIKGLEGGDLKDEINQIMQTTLLTDEAQKITKSLSGGNKRKLSLAQALIGGSQVIFLDEPTSGMDAMSRRVIWEILERVKQEHRTIVLTTHHLDEAEVLADRIAIMAAGKLLACGRCDYIKVNFGEGYQIQMVLQDKSIRKDDIINFTSKRLPQAVLDPQSSENSLLYQISFKQKPQLLNFFTEFEKQFGDRVAVNFRINSLEDAFVNIGMDEEKFIQRAQRHQLGLGASINEEMDSVEPDGQFAEQQAQAKVPSCLSRSPQYIFKQQFAAIFLRKYYTTIRTFSNYLAIIIPFVLIIVGTLAIGQIDFSGGSEEYDLIEKQDAFIRQMFISIFIIIAFCFNSSIFILQPVLERETNLKYALIAMGCRDLPYWLGTFAFDYLLYLIFVLLFLLLSVITKLEFITNYILQIFYIFFTFGISFCFFSYFIGALIYRKASRAMKTFPFLNYFVIFGVFLDLWIITAMIFSKGDLTEYTFSSFESTLLQIIDFIGAMFSPFYNVYKTFITLMDSRDFQESFDVPQISHTSYFYSTMMLFQGWMYFLLTIKVEQKTYNNISDQIKHVQPFENVQINDPDVHREVDKLQSNQQLPIRVLNMQKFYKKGGVLAVKDISFGVEPNQILGLLGPNGAGKTTTFSILTSLIGKSNGSVKIKNVEINRDQSDVFRETGICPQFDCIWENLTPPEHLYLFGRMKGLSGQDLHESVQYFLSTMQLEEYLTRKAGRLSGGNKRKLCVSNALIGGPSIQFFDEPSTGVDPIARRFLWKTLKQGVKLRVSSVVLTTHTMDEAESLCDRIAIMINGQLYCIGSPKELKDKYGEGYNIQMKHVEQQENVLNLIQKQFPHAYRIADNQEEYFTVHIPTQEFKFFRVFEMMTEFEEKQLIKDFYINQSTLESVFLQFSRLQQQVSYT